MAITVTSSVSGSLIINNNGVINYQCNLSTANIIGDLSSNSVSIQNSNEQVIQQLPLSQIINIGGTAFSGTLQQAVDQIAALVEIQTNPIFPPFGGLVWRANFANQSSVTTVSGKVSQIVDQVGGIVSSQATAGNRPTYTTSGGANGNAFATFGIGNVPLTLTGSVLPATGDFTVFIIRRLAGTGLPGDKGVSFQNGNASGYAWADWQPGASGVSGSNSGGVYDGNGSVQAANWYTSNSRWEICCLSHTNNSSFLYNSLGVKFTPASPTLNPPTPVTGHTIGSNNGVVGYFWLVGDMEDILLYNRQLSDAEVLQMCQYLAYNYALTLPKQVRNGGDSIMVGVPGGTPNCPTEVAIDLLPTKYFYIFNTAVSGRVSADVLANLSAEVLTQYQSTVTNVYYLMIGHNDIVPGVNHTTPAQYIANIASIGAQVRAQGYKFVMMTILYSTAYTNATCDTYNTLIRSNWTQWADALLDANQLPNLLDPNNATYYLDGTHPTSLGSQQIATALEPILSTFI